MFVFDEWNERNACVDVRVITFEYNLVQSCCFKFVINIARLYYVVSKQVDSLSIA